MQLYNTEQKMEVLLLTMLLLLRSIGQAKEHHVRARRWDASLQNQSIWNYIFSSLLPIRLHKFVHLNILLYNSVCTCKIIYFYMLLLRKLQVHFFYS